MRRLAPLAVVSLLVLAGCASTPDEPEARLTEEAAALPEECIEISPGATAALQHGMDEAGAGFTIQSIGGIPADDGTSWWVAARATTDDEDVTAVWLTVNDPTIDQDNAYLSATELASLISYYHLPEDLSGADPVEAAKDCLP